MKTVFAFMLLCCYSINASVLSQSLSNSVFAEWDEFKLRHSKKYDTENEEKFRFLVYLNNRHLVAKHNALYDQGLVTFDLEMNQFGDWTLKEFNEKMNGFKMTNESSLTMGFNRASYVEPANIQIPGSIDWRQHGAVTSVKNQGHCGSCWAFASTGALEGQHFRHTGRLVSLSEQNLVDCSGQYGNHGCNGGNMNNAYNYVKSNHGIDTEQSYPYEARLDSCRYNPRNSGADDAGSVNLPAGNEGALQSAVASAGPVAVAIDASKRSFMFYKNGVMYDPQCSTTKLTHAVLVVGYGNDNGQDYWLVKNSWGESWGQGGYIRMARNRGNNCGIATYAVYPLVR